MKRSTGRPNSRQADRGLNTNSKRWKAIRAQVLAEQPLCPICQRQGRVVPAVDVDHKDNDSHNQERSNLWGLCREHHAEKSFSEANGRTWKVKGCNERGEPIDPGHHWNQ